MVAGREMAVSRRQQQVAVLGAAVLGAVGEALRALQPRARLAHLAEGKETKADPERRIRRPQLFARLEPQVIEPLQHQLPLAVSSAQPGRDREQLEVGVAQRELLIGARKRCVGVRPCALRACAASEFELTDGGLGRAAHPLHPY
jgi:hypothetical protein